MNTRKIRTLVVTLSAFVATSTAVSQAQTTATVADLAIRFGAQASMTGPELSPDGKRLVYLEPGPGTSNLVYVVDLATQRATPIARADGQPLRLIHCGWVSSERLACKEYGLRRDVQVIAFTRMFAMDADGKNMVALGRSDTDKQLYTRQFDGSILDWLSGTDPTVLMTRYYVPESETGTHLAQTGEGYGVDLIDTRSHEATSVERPQLNARYWSDGRGSVRMMSRQSIAHDDLLSDKVTYYYRAPGNRDWQKFKDGKIEPLAVDSGANAAYVLKHLDGRRALYRIALDGTEKTELVFAHPQVDVDDVVTIGRNGRVIGASYQTEKPQIEYFDPTYKQLAAALAHAIPKLPIIEFVSASADEKVLLIFAGSDNDPGRYYVFDRTTHHLDELGLVRPYLEKTELAHVSAVSYPAADGTLVPAYLTLPPQKDKATGLPAIVLPHGGPAARDVWGFDWLAQYYASRGFAVLQPNYRGSAGYGNDWFVKNGFKSWKIAIGDIVDGGRWLIAQGADPNKLAIVGWSYGGYAALQTNVVDPNLFKAVVAIAPVTDLEMLKRESEGFTNELIRNDYIGSGPHIEAGSPARHAEVFKAPVMLFHGEVDGNVDVAESRAMDRALHRADKQSELIVYPKLDHQLPDSAVRADMLRRSYEFLRTNLKLD